MGKDNRYPRINPHLNSHLLHVGGWEDFHTCHVNDMRCKLAELLPDHYTAQLCDSLQVASPGMVDAGKTLSSIVVMRLEKPITRIELLTPLNKPTCIHAAKYRVQRETCLNNGMHLVEIDYIHSCPPLLPRIPSYPDRETGAFPYMVLRTDCGTRLTFIHSTGVLEPVPEIPIPLFALTVIWLDLGEVYNITFSSNQAFYEVFTDYTREPVNFDAYNDADKTLIREHMAKIASSPQD
jgi:hypothetical protein